VNIFPEKMASSVKPPELENRTSFMIAPKSGREATPLC